MRDSVLVIGYGNPGRRDDGLGPALAERLAAEGLPGVDVDSGYQLQIEDSYEVSRHDRVVFADADVLAPAPFRYEEIEPRPGGSFTSHSISPEALLALTEQHFGRRPRAFVLGIRGYDFDGYGEGLSPGAKANLGEAASFLVRRLLED